MELTLDTILNLPNVALEVSDAFSDNAVLLDKALRKKYDIKKLKKKIEEKFLDYQENIYCVKYSIPLKKATTIDYKDYTKSNELVDSILLMVDSNLQSENFLINFYRDIIRVSMKLTKKEAIYFVDTFFRNKSEDFIAEKLLMSRSSLYSVKESCIIKVASELKILE